MKKLDYNYIEWTNSGSPMGPERFLRSRGISSNLFLNALHRDAIKVDGKERKRKEALLHGETVRLFFETEQNHYEPIDLGLDLLYEDADLLVINKPENLLVHHGKEISLANHVSYLQKKRGLERAVRFVNRIDRDTAGALICALNPFAQAVLSKQMQRDEMDKIYLAVLTRRPPQDEGLIDIPLAQSQDDPRYLPNPGGKESRTAYRFIFEKDGLFVYAVRLLSGRTHQIRAHFAAIGCPIYGDGLYGRAIDQRGQRLLAWKLAFYQPRSHNRIEITAPIPEKMRVFL